MGRFSSYTVKLSSEKACGSMKYQSLQFIILSYGFIRIFYTDLNCSHQHMPAKQNISVCMLSVLDACPAAPGSWEGSPEEATEEALLLHFKTKLCQTENSWKLHYYIQGQTSSKEVKVRGRSKTR